MNTRTSYDIKAEKFLKRCGLTFRASEGAWIAPPWAEDNPHGLRHQITLKGENPRRRLSFQFWNSKADMDAGKAPTPYDVLSCISVDSGCPESFEDFCAEYGYERDSRMAFSTYKRCRKFADRLAAFFTAEELEDLQEIQ